jgi:membrane-bound lytic murein transglycosylase B
MVAIWGLESNFGRFTGTYPTIRALATLAYDNRRPLFRTELFHALTMVDRGVQPADMKGSWAGAMGQPQFMPSSFVRHAVDFNEDGRIDIWSSPADVFGSMGSYLKNAGWVAGERWGREVRVSRTVLDRIDQQVPMRSGGCRAVRDMTAARPLGAWQELGVRLTSGQPLPVSTLDASLVRGSRRFFLVYRNYEALIDYNCSNSYALSAGLLADRIF